MQTDNLLHKALLAGLVLLGGCNLVRNSSASKPEAFSVNDCVWKFVTQKELNASLAQSPDKKLLLNIYPVKRSLNSAKQDFDLSVFFQDAAVPEKNLGGKMDYKTFEEQSTWYINFLRSKKVDRKDIPLGYFIQIDGSTIGDNIAGINMCWWPQAKTVQYYFLSAPGGGTKLRDTVPKCPPDCLYVEILRKGIATARFSPSGKFELLWEKNVKAIIDNSYNTQTYGLTKHD